MSRDPVGIASYARTPIGGFQGVFAPVKATEPGSAAIAAALNRATIAPNAVDRACALNRGIDDKPDGQIARDRSVDMMMFGGLEDASKRGVAAICRGGGEAAAIASK